MSMPSLTWIGGSTTLSMGMGMMRERVWQGRKNNWLILKKIQTMVGVLTYGVHNIRNKFRGGAFKIFISSMGPRYLVLTEIT